MDNPFPKSDRVNRNGALVQKAENGDASFAGRKQSHKSWHGLCVEEFTHTIPNSLLKRKILGMK